MERAEEAAGLVRAATAAADDGRVVLLVTRGAEWVVTALVSAANLNEHGFHGTLLVAGSQKECDFATRQAAVPVRACAWQPWANSNEMFRARLRYIDTLAHAGFAVLMADTDMCFSDNPYTWLDEQGQRVLFSGTSFGDYNLGVNFADGRGAPDAPELGVWSEVNARMEAFERELYASPQQKDDPGWVDPQVLWDQALVNDVWQTWVTGRPVYSRSCNLAHLKEGTCFSRCCDPQALRAGDGEPELKAEDDKLRDNYPGIRGSTLGLCSGAGGVTHRNTCGTNHMDPGLYNHTEWLRHVCWPGGEAGSALTDLLGRVRAADGNIV